MRNHVLLAVPFALVASVPALAQSADWERYVDPQYGFSAELPYGMFDPLEDDGSGGLTLGEVGGTGQISIYGGEAGGLTLEQQLAMVRAGIGLSGRNIDYVLNTARHLEELGIHDRPLMALAALLEQQAA